MLALSLRAGVVMVLREAHKTAPSTYLPTQLKILYHFYLKLLKVPPYTFKHVTTLVSAPFILTKILQEALTVINKVCSSHNKRS